ncbi:hypothetical protein SLEP1_g55853 [Rubroshorea leprosula]|uniref:Uncharacterized protein n=1 Tax=Rubroshorea leprosula TaxID=152421 RepID=A0AAV5MHP2_9ROSI|nr:hypothetical protein SLEP1_g55853 [Rubroshorea leprosula]
MGGILVSLHIIAVTDLSTYISNTPQQKWRLHWGGRLRASSCSTLLQWYNIFNILPQQYLFIFNKIFLVMPIMRATSSCITDGNQELGQDDGSSHLGLARGSIKDYSTPHQHEDSTGYVMGKMTAYLLRQGQKRRDRDTASPPPIPFTIEELDVFRDQWIANDAITLPQSLREPSSDDKCNLKQKVDEDPFPSHNQGAVNVLTHVESVGTSASIVEFLDNAPNLFVRALQQTLKFKMLFNQLGLTTEALRRATEAILFIANETRGKCLNSEAHANCAYLESSNAITFTDKDMEAPYPDHRKPLYLSTQINFIGVKHAFIDARSSLNLISLSTIIARQYLTKSAPYYHHGTTSKIILILIYEAFLSIRGRRRQQRLSKHAQNALELSFSMGGSSILYEALVAHSLNVDTKVKPVVQPNRAFHQEVTLKIKEEIEKLLATGFIKLNKKPTWLAYIVPVQKKNGQIRCCIDFCDLNKACPKNEFSVPNMACL